MRAVAETLPAARDDRLVAVRRVAIVPALNEAPTIARVIEEIRAVDPGFEILVIDDGSTDGTQAEAERAGALVVRLPYNVGIGGAVQTGYQYARDHGFQVAVQIDGDGQHDPAELSPTARADRRRPRGHGRRQPFPRRPRTTALRSRRLGIHLFCLDRHADRAAAR